MFGFSLGEFLLLAVIALIVIGPKQLPEFARQIGKLINEIKRSAGDFAQEIKEQAKVDLDLNNINPRLSEDDYAKHISDGLQTGHATTQTNESQKSEPTKEGQKKDQPT